jgi:hypothetical protein
VKEHFVLAFIGNDETEAFIFNDPLNCSGHINLPPASMKKDRTFFVKRRDRRRLPCSRQNIVFTAP